MALITRHSRTRSRSSADRSRRYNPGADELALAVEETLFHEIGHHLGISDARLSELALERRQRSAR